MVVMHVIPFHCIWHIINHSVNSQEKHSEKFSLARKINPISGYENLVAVEKTEDNLLPKIDFFEFSRFSGYIYR